MKRLFIILLALPLSAQVQSIVPGLWSNPATWNGGVVPGAANEEVIITQPVFLDSNLTSVHNIRVMRYSVQITSTASITGCPTACVGAFVTATQNPRLAVGSRVTLSGFPAGNSNCINTTVATPVLTNADATHFTAAVSNTCANVGSTGGVGSASQYGHLCSYDGTHASTEADCVYNRSSAHSILFNSTGTANTGTGTGTAGNPDSGATMFGLLALDRSPDGYDTIHLAGSSTINLTIDTVNATNRWYMIAAYSSGYSGGCNTLGTAGCTGGATNNARGPSVTFSGVISNHQGNPTVAAANVYDGIHVDQNTLWTTKPVFTLAHSHLYQFGRINAGNPTAGVANGFTLSYNWFDDPKSSFGCTSGGLIAVVCSTVTSAYTSGNINIDHNTMTAGADTATYTSFVSFLGQLVGANWSNNAAFGASDGSIQVGALAVSSQDNASAPGGNTITNNLVINNEGSVSSNAGIGWTCTSGDTTSTFSNNVLFGTANPMNPYLYGPCGQITNNYMTEWQESAGGQMVFRGYTTLSTIGCAVVRNNVITMENTSNNTMYLPYSIDSSANACFYTDNNSFVNFTSSGNDSTAGAVIGDAGTPAHAKVTATVNSTYTNNIIAFMGTATTAGPTFTGGLSSRTDNNTWLTTKCANSVGVCNNLTYLATTNGTWNSYSLCNTSVCVPNPTGGTGFDNGTVRHPNTLYGDVDQVNPLFFDSSRHGISAVTGYDAQVCGGPGTWADFQAQFANRWNGTNNACADGLAFNQWILAGYKPYNGQLKGAGNGGADIGAIPVFPAAIIQ